MLLEIPLQAIPNQKVTAFLNGQTVSFNIYTAGEYLYSTVTLDQSPIIAGNIATHASYINQYPTPLVGYLFWFTFDALNPVWQTLGTSSHLLYADYDALELYYEQWVAANILIPIPQVQITLLEVIDITGQINYLGVDPDDETVALGVEWF